jgi:hypothetical protein
MEVLENGVPGGLEESGPSTYLRSGSAAQTAFKK